MAKKMYKMITDNSKVNINLLEENELLKEKIQKIKFAFEETIWMAIRYADSRNTYAPSTVRDAVKEFQKVFPEWKPRYDGVIKEPKEEDIKGLNFASDYLHDIFKDIEEIELCGKSNCTRPKLEGNVYCSYHYDINFG